MTKKKFCILFAGPIGSSKTPIASFLSQEIGLPIFSNDSIRTEIAEDIGNNKVEREGAYTIKRDARLLKILESGKSFILDVSIDRRWEIVKRELENFDYFWSIISLDLDRKLLIKLYKNKGYKIDNSLSRTLKDHRIFLKKYKKEIGLSISNKNFNRRMELSLKFVNEWRNSFNQKSLKTIFF